MRPRSVVPGENFRDSATRAAGPLRPHRVRRLRRQLRRLRAVSEEIGRHCGATAPTFNMHVATMLWTGPVQDFLSMTDEQREHHEWTRAELYRGVVEEGRIHSQPFSEGISPGATSGIATRAVPVEGGFLVTGRKIFRSLSGAADFGNVTAQVEGEDHIRFLGVPASVDGVRIEGAWDRSACGGHSRTIVMDRALVPAEHEWLPPGLYDQAASGTRSCSCRWRPPTWGSREGSATSRAQALRGACPG